MEALRRTSPVPLTIEPMQDNMDGFFSPTAQRIAIRQGMSEVQTVVKNGGWEIFPIPGILAC